MVRLVASQQESPGFDEQLRVVFAWSLFVSNQVLPFPPTVKRLLVSVCLLCSGVVTLIGYFSAFCPMNAGKCSCTLHDPG